jgi:SSS family transporter
MASTLTALDYVIIAVYLVGIATLGIWAGGSQETTDDYFLGGRNLPWWAVCLSVVATETSTLTVLSVPTVAYGGAMTFVQLALGYLVGRTVVAFLFLPSYYRGNLSTAYAFLGERFGPSMQASASVTFLVTRLLADGVRLFATAIPLKIIAESAGFELSYFAIIAIIGAVTIIYTLIGGIRAVVWMDAVQMLLYLFGAVFTVTLLLGEVPGNWFQVASEAGKTQILNVELGEGLSAWLTSPYAFVTAVLGGAVFSMASHGTDQLVVQRLLACRDLRDSQKAIIGSALLVGVQFLLFLFIGVLLWISYDGATLAELGYATSDELFPRFIVSGLPMGMSGLLLAGIIAAAMSTLSSSLNALASSTMLDLYELFTSAEPFSERTVQNYRSRVREGPPAGVEGAAVDEYRPPSDLRRAGPAPKRAVFLSRVATLAWGVVFIAFANLFKTTDNPVVELGLSIASFTYGGLLGAFLLGLVSERARERDAIISFFATIAAMALVIFGVWHGPAGWVFEPVEGLMRALGLGGGGAEGYRQIGYPWYALMGSALCVGLGSLLATRHRRKRAA